MSEPKRFTDLQVWETLHFGGSTGGWVRWEDYLRIRTNLDEARLDAVNMNVFFKAENARLKADVNELADGLKLASEVGIKIADEVTRLKAENARLKEEVEYWKKGCER